MSAKKTERLLNLVICLLATRRFLGVQQIRQAVPGYDSDTEEAFRRMFERDKEELRELGIPLETGTDNRTHDDELGYRIARRDYELPEVVLEPDEAAALGLAARLWQSAPLAGATGSALLKLQAAGIDVRQVSGALEPRVAASEPAFAACLGAVRDGRPVRFAYRTAGRDAPEQRQVQPWGVVSWHGRWYLVGYDDARAASRVFRLSRVVGDVSVDTQADRVAVPPGIDLRAEVARLTGAPVHATATVRLRSGAGWALRSEATAVRTAPGWDEIDVGYSDPERLADRVAGLGAAAVVLGPKDARAAVLQRLTAAAARPVPGLREVTARTAGPVRRGRSEGGQSKAGAAQRRPVEQLPRLLALVPYLLARPGVRVAEVAQVFGVSEERLRKDLDLLWVCGLPGHGPGDLIDVEFEGDTITLFEPAGVTRPLRLTVNEALALVVALRALSETPGLSDPGPAGAGAVDRALAKIEQVAGAAAVPAGRVEVNVEGAAWVLPVVREALDRGRRLHLAYYVPGRDETTERDVDPMRLLLVEGRSYLEAWCRRAEGVRLFRLDRVAEVQLLDQPAQPPPEAVWRDVSQGLFHPSPEHQLVVLALRPGAHWVADYYPCESVEPGPGGELVVRLRTPDTRWVRRLALRLGAAARVLEPARLGTQVRQDAERALVAYRPTP